MSWGSFLLGMLLGGFGFFLLGFVIGALGTQTGQMKTDLESIMRDIGNSLDRDKPFIVSVFIGDPDDDDDEDDDEDFPCCEGPFESLDVRRN